MIVGKASFNWRMLFDVELGHNTRSMKFPYMHLQLWDRDILKWNDCAGEGVIDLGKYYRKAYKKNVALKVSLSNILILFYVILTSFF
jgi:hypothetical protein